MMTHRQRFMAALSGAPPDRTPVFPLLMFLAADRAGLTYHEYATDGRALAGAQLMVQERFDLDAITVCSDAFRVPADLGGDMAYPEDRTPYLRRPLVTAGTEKTEIFVGRNVPMQEIFHVTTQGGFGCVRLREV